MLYACFRKPKTKPSAGLWFHLAALQLLDLCLEDSAGGQALDFAILRFLDQDSAKGQALDFAILILLSALHLNDRLNR